MTTLVCLGDSFTEGMCDARRPDGHYLGWADRVAAALGERARATGAGPVAYANLAVRGKLLDQVVAEQVPRLAGLSPDLTTFHAGANDVLRRVDLADLFRRYDDAVGRVADQMAASAGRLVLFTSIGRAGGTGRLAQRLADRFAAFNRNVRQVAARHGATVVDLEPVVALTDRRMWDTDRLHLNPAGHARVAAAVLEHLDVDDPSLVGGPTGWWREPLPPRPPARRRDEAVADLAWVGQHLVPWIGRRLRGVSSGDGLEPKDPVPRPVGVP